jgi:uncharacterized membrane protein (DUF106 family)
MVRVFKEIIKFFDKLEDKIRHRLSHHSIIYALIAATAIVVFWSGVERIASAFLSPVLSVIVSVVVMLATGTLVSFFIGESILISGLKEEKRVDQKTEEEIREEDMRIKRIFNEIDEMNKDIKQIKEILMSMSDKNKLS